MNRAPRWPEVVQRQFQLRVVSTNRVQGGRRQSEANGGRAAGRGAGEDGGRARSVIWEGERHLGGGHLWLRWGRAVSQNRV